MTLFRVWFHPKEGSFGFIIFDWWFHLKAPWAMALYSERYGGDSWTPICRGWRFKFRKIKRFLE